MLTGRNSVEILQDAAAFYPRLMEDLQKARHSIHLQYFIWGADSFTEDQSNPRCESPRRSEAPSL